MWITKQIFPFFFCFIRELNPYSPLTFSLIPRANSKPRVQAGRQGRAQDRDAEEACAGGTGVAHPHCYGAP